MPMAKRLVIAMAVINSTKEKPLASLAANQRFHMGQTDVMKDGFCIMIIRARRLDNVGTVRYSGGLPEFGSCCRGQNSPA